MKLADGEVAMTNSEKVHDRDQANTQKKKDKHEINDEEILNKKEICPQKLIKKGVTKKEEPQVDPDLIPRGPSRIERAPVSHHPYRNLSDRSHVVTPQRPENEYYGQSTVENRLVWGEDSPETIRCNSSPGTCSNDSSPENFQHDQGYFSSSPPEQQSPITGCSQKQSPLPIYPLPEVVRLLNDEGYQVGAAAGISEPIGASAVPGPSKPNEEIPQDVSDFILMYSRRYSGSNSVESTDGHEANGHSRDSSVSDGFDKGRPASASSSDSGCISPLSAGAAAGYTPDAPYGTLSNNCDEIWEAQYRSEDAARARERFRNTLDRAKLDEAFFWACTAVNVTVFVYKVLLIEDANFLC